MAGFFFFFFLVWGTRTRDFRELTINEINENYALIHRFARPPRERHFLDVMNSNNSNWIESSGEAILSLLHRYSEISIITRWKVDWFMYCDSQFALDLRWI